MEPSRTEYSNLLATLQPEQAISILSDRVSVISKINNDIADWLQERRRVEEAYVAGLRKLARRSQQDGAAALGIFQMPWQRIVSGTENLAASHETLATKIETDVETPLRTWSSRSREMQDLGAAQASLGSITRDLSNAQRKAAKGGRKADSASSTVEDASRQWEAQAPFVFEQLQAADESRVNLLRDVLTQFQTHEVDALEKNKLSAESCLNALLNVETADEIKTFAMRASAGAPSIPRRLSTATAATARPTSSSLRSPPTPPPPRHAADNRQSQHPDSFAGQDRLTPLPAVPAQKEKKLGGLKRLGTVMSRRKSVVPPVPQSSMEEKRKTRSFVPFRRGDSSRSFQDLEESGQDLTPTVTREQPTSSASPGQRHELPSRDLPEPPLPLTNGGPLPQLPPQANVDTEPSQPAAAESANLGASALSANNPYQQPTLHEPPSSNLGPMAQAQLEAASPADDSARNFMIRDKPIQEDETEAQLAMRLMATQLRTQAQTSGLGRTQGSVRGRRDVRNTMYVPSSTDVLPENALAATPATTSAVTTPPAEHNLASPIQRPPPANILHDDHGVGSDTTSIHSTRSTALPSHHADLHEPGLNASIVETVHSWFTESGISKSFVIGEVALAYNPAGLADVDHETIRLHRFELLDKVAANPIFLTAVKATENAPLAEEQAGSYTVATSAIRRPSPMVGLKYQLHLEDGNVAQYSPVLLTPAWQIVEGQVSIIILYSLNPVFGSEPLTLRNVAITVNLDTSGEGAGKAVSAMMSPTPGATFRRKNSAVVWRLNEFTVRPEQERLLVRFITQGGVPKKGTVELKFELAGRTASGVGVERRVSIEKERDPFADDDGAAGAGSADDEAAAAASWEPVATKAKLLSGRYTAS